LSLRSQSAKQSRLLKSDLAGQHYAKGNEDSGRYGEESAGTPAQNKAGC
jgi:hypothetical protein